jgi:hypothetical protein
MVFLTPVVVVCRAPGCQIDAISVHADDRGFVPKARPPSGFSLLKEEKL